MFLNKIIDHLDKVGKRRPSFEIMAEHILAQKNPVILELGSCREWDNYEGDGLSTLFFANLIWSKGTEEHSGKLTTVDCDPDAIELTKKILYGSYKNISPEVSDKTPLSDIEKSTIFNKINFHISSSVPFLEKNGFRTFAISGIDLVYFDSLDMEYPDPEPAFLNTLFEFMLIKPYLKKGSLIVVDDNIESIRTLASGKSEKMYISKGHYVRKFMESINVQPIYEDYQVIWQMGIN